MNKVILLVALVALGLSGFNTYLLLQITGAIKNAGKEIAPVAQQLEKLQPILKKLQDTPSAVPPELPKDKTELPKDKLELPKDKTVDDKLPDPKGKLRLPPGPPPK